MKAIGNKVLVELDETEEQTKGGIILPDKAQETNVWGTVVSVGDKVEQVHIGTKVFISPTQGTHVVSGKKDLIFIEDFRILAMLSED